MKAQSVETDQAEQFERDVNAAIGHLRRWWMSEYFDGTVPRYVRVAFSTAVIDAAVERLDLPLIGHR